MIQGQVELYCKCRNCGEFFEIKKKRAKYCSESCRMKAFYRRKKAANETA